MNDFYGSGSRDALMKVYGGEKHTEVAEEFILPDYLPDVKRIIRADVSPKIDGKYVSSGKLDYDGEAVCRILFTDENNELHTASFSAAFSDGVEIPSVSDECIANLAPLPESLSCRTVNPRRIAVKLRIDTEIGVWCTASFRPEFCGEYSEKNETLNEEIPVMKLICAGENGLTASADIEADGALPQVGKIITCDVDMCFYECKGADGRVLCRGDMPITVFYSSPGEDGDIYTVLYRKLPVAQVIAAEGIDDGYECTAKGSVDGVKVKVSENGFGERRIIELDITYRLYLNCVGNGRVTLTKDIYSCDREVKTETGKKSFFSFIRNYSASFSANHIAEAGEVSLGEAESVLCAYARPRVENVTLDRANRRLTVEGKAGTGAVLRERDGLSSTDYEVPFKLELEAAGVPESFVFNGDTVCMSARARLDGGKLYTDLELQLNLTVLEARECEYISVAEFGDTLKNEENAPQMRFFYPSDGETLWSVGKVFGIPRERIAEANNIRADESVLPNVLMIPKK